MVAVLEIGPTRLEQDQAAREAPEIELGAVATGMCVHVCTLSPMYLCLYVYVYMSICLCIYIYIYFSLSLSLSIYIYI